MYRGLFLRLTLAKKLFPIFSTSLYDQSLVSSTLAGGICSSATMAQQNQTTAGIIVIGDEILKGFTADSNSHFLAKHLFDMGIAVKRISVIPDDLKVIANEVKHFSDTFDHVITSGGVGPTHDDMTYEGVAMAFDEICEMNDEIASAVRTYFAPQHDSNTINAENSGFMKLAMIPRNATLLWGVHPTTGDKSLYPVVRVKNVTIFPGIPKLLQRAFEMIKHEFPTTTAMTHYKLVLYSKLDEFHIGDKVSAIARDNADVNVGSYPSLTHSYYRVQITIDSTTKERSEAVYETLKTALHDSIVLYDGQPLENAVMKLDKFVGNQDEQFGELVTEARQIIAMALDQYRLEELGLSFNGGKDCTALLHLVHCCLVARNQHDQATQTTTSTSDAANNKPMKLSALYVQPATPFPEQETFIHDCVHRYNLNLLTIRSQENESMRETLHRFTKDHPEIKAVFLGGRLHDPGHAELKPMQRTDPGWPDMMRVHPLLHWHYGDIWKLLRGLYLPYLKLYDRGYTSIGGQQTTKPNAALEFRDGFGQTRYKPAYMLDDPSLERAGRDKS